MDWARLRWRRSSGLELGAVAEDRRTGLGFTVTCRGAVVIGGSEQRKHGDRDAGFGLNLFFLSFFLLWTEGARAEGAHGVAGQI